ncbi:MFS transporter [Halothermothrix orenii]|uniref:MFS transporter n=1 Tax=Halothermothrix orenii TaxID=31909 RepID=UPI00006B0960|nr:MFS transporter [Halothermothrix orenii]
MALPFYIVFAREVFEIGESYIGRYLLFQIGGTIISNIIWDYLSRKAGSLMVVRTCILLGGLIPVVAILTSFYGPDVFVIVFILIGFIKSGRRIGFDPYLLEIAPEGKRTVYLGVRGTLNFLIVLMPVFGGVFIDLVGFYITFIIVSLVMFIAYKMVKGPSPK